MTLPINWTTAKATATCNGWKLEVTISTFDPAHPGWFARVYAEADERLLSRLFASPAEAMAAAEKKAREQKPQKPQKEDELAGAMRALADDLKNNAKRRRVARLLGRRPR